MGFSLSARRYSRTRADTDVSISAARIRASRWVSSSTDTVIFLKFTTSHFL